MIEVKVFDLPKRDDSHRKIEEKLCELISKYRNNENLDEVELNWMDEANTWLM